MFFFDTLTGTYNLGGTDIVLPDDYGALKDMGVDHSYRYVKIPANPEDALVNMFDMNIMSKSGDNIDWSIPATVDKRYFVSIFNGSYASGISNITCTSGATVITSSSIITINGDSRKANHVAFIVKATSTTMKFSGTSHNYGRILFYSEVPSNFNGYFSTVVQTDTATKNLELSIPSTAGQIYIISAINMYWKAHTSPHNFNVTDGGVIYNNYNNGGTAIQVEPSSSYHMYPTICICKAKGDMLYYTRGFSYGNGCSVLQLTSY